MLQFGTFESLTKLVHVHVTDAQTPVINFLCGSISGAMGTLVSMPCDTIRTRLVGQGEPKVSANVYHMLLLNRFKQVPCIVLLCACSCHHVELLLSFKCFQEAFRLIHA